MISTLHIDWLSITFPIDSEKSVKRLSDIRLWHDLLAPHFTVGRSKWRVSKPLFGYTEAYVSEHGVQAMYGRAEMGLHVIYSGQALQAMYNAGYDTEGIIKNANSLGARCTRCDIALDILDGASGVDVYAANIRVGRAKSASKTWRNLENAEGGKTLYIGSRASERMVRIYDKKAERAAAFVTVDANSWIRAECELKGDRARDFLKACKDNKIEDVMVSHLVSAVDFPTVADWKQATTTGGKWVEPTETHRKDTKTRHWLMSSVALIIAKEAAHDGVFYAKLLTEINSQIEAILGKKDN